MPSSPSTANVLPGTFSIPRLTTLAVALICAFASGTNYVFSAYSPQLGKRLGITHTQLNLIGLGGNVGVYLSGPLWGRIVDKRGPRILFICGFTFLLIGYSGMRYLYDTGLPKGVESLSMTSFILLILFSVLTGSGGNAGLTACVNSIAKTFPDRTRATTTGIVISGFGLSAFLFSTIAHIAYPGNTSEFLQVLALGTALPMILGFFFVRPIPLPPSELMHSPDIEELEEEAAAGGADTSALLDDEEGDQVDSDDGELGLNHDHSEDDSNHRSPLLSSHPRRDTVELSPARHGFRPPTGSRRSSSLGLGRGDAKGMEGMLNVYGKALFKNGDFWLLCSILSLLSGTGLMYINNVGSMAQALYAYDNKAYNEADAATWQATQVSAISIMNFSSRIIIGLVADFAKNRLKVPRSYCLVLVSLFFLISQITASRVQHIKDLWVASGLLGLAHGSVFSLFPTICIEWFGLPHFSENWGYVSLSPMLGGNIFSIAFGQNLDRHEDKASSSTSAAARALTSKVAENLTNNSSSPASPSPVLCKTGNDCYVATLYLTIFGCFLALLLSIFAGWRDRRKQQRSLASLHGQRRRRRADVVWEDPSSDD